MGEPTPAEVTTDRFVKAFNVRHVVEDGMLVEYDMPGWAFADFTRTGKLGFWNIHKFMEVDRCLTYLVPSQAESHFSGMVSSTIGSFTPALYSSAAFELPMTCRRTYGYIGNTSYSIVVECRNRQTGDLLAKVERQTVAIDPQTRRPTPLPEHLARLRSKFPNKGPRVVVSDLPSDPTQYYQYRVKVAASDTDQIYHVNQAIYFKFSFDGAYEAAGKGFLKNFTKDICEYEAESSVAKFVAEAHAGDILTVALWEDTSSSLTLHFKVTKGDTNVFFATVKFHSVDKSHI